MENAPRPKQPHPLQGMKAADIKPWTRGALNRWIPLRLSRLYSKRYFLSVGADHRIHKVTFRQLSSHPWNSLGTMRITGGQAKGRLLASLKGWNIRPTSDRVREAVFNLIGQDVSGFKVLDLFAGTGCLGIEALSRGASQALFIDNSIQSIKLIKRNLARCGYESLGSVLRKDLTRGLPRKHPLLKEKFDLIFLDPPYEKKMIPPLLGELSDRGLLASPSIAVAESFKTETLPEVSGQFQMVIFRTYGETKISIYHFAE